MFPLKASLVYLDFTLGNTAEGGDCERDRCLGEGGERDPRPRIRVGRQQVNKKEHLMLWEAVSISSINVTCRLERKVWGRRWEDPNRYWGQIWPVPITVALGMSLDFSNLSSLISEIEPQ